MSLRPPTLNMHQESYDSLRAIAKALNRTFVAVLDDMVEEYKERHARELAAAKEKEEKRKHGNCNGNPSVRPTANAARA